MLLWQTKQTSLSPRGSRSHLFACSQPVTHRCGKVHETGMGKGPKMGWLSVSPPGHPHRLPLLSALARSKIPRNPPKRCWFKRESRTRSLSSFPGSTLSKSRALLEVVMGHLGVLFFPDGLFRPGNEIFPQRITSCRLGPKLITDGVLIWWLYGEVIGSRSWGPGI